MSLFSGIGQKQARGDYSYIGPGDYLVYINEFSSKLNRAKVGRIFFNLTVVAVLDDTEAVKAAMAPHRVGDTSTWMMDVSKDATLPTLKRALMQVTGVPEAEVTEDFCEALASAAQPLKGYFMEYHGQQIKTKEKGNLITLRSFRRRWTRAMVEANAEVMKNVQLLKLDVTRAGD